MKAGASGAGGPALAGIRVLVAEDEAVIALDLGETLRTLGCVVCTATVSGAEVLALVRRECPDVVLLDLSLADGFARPLAEALRAKGVPFVLATGYAPEDVARAVEVVAGLLRGERPARLQPGLELFGETDP